MDNKRKTRVWQNNKNSLYLLALLYLYTEVPQMTMSYFSIFISLKWNFFSCKCGLGISHKQLPVYQINCIILHRRRYPIKVLFHIPILYNKQNFLNVFDGVLFLVKFNSNKYNSELFIHKN